MIVYKITNLINKKTYIGQTIGSIENRWSRHLRDDSRCTYISNAIKKYGKENFTIEEIGGANNRSELNYQEWLFIHKYDSLWPDGYNLIEGGSVRSVWATDLDKLKKQKDIGRNIEPWNKGKTITFKNPKERGLKISKAKKGIKVSENTLNATRKKVKCIETGEVYKSISDAARAIGSYTTNITKQIQGKTKHNKGFSFKYIG